MKKSLLLSTALLVGVGAFAQSNRQARIGVLYPKVRPAAIDAVEGTSTQKTVKPNVNGVQTSNLFGNSRNGFGTLVEVTNPLHYNADLNMLAFTQRLPVLSSWPVTGLPTGSGVSGYQVTMASTDNGQTWDGVCYYSNATYWGRYPSGVIANPIGNTNSALAKFVATGPCTGSPGGWWGNFFASVPVDSAVGTNNVVGGDEQAMDITNQNAATLTYFSSYNTVANGSTVWTGVRKSNGTDFYGSAVIKGTPGATVNDPYTWTQDSVTFGPFAVNTGGDYAASEPKIAFSPDGQTGYIVINGVLASATGEATKSLQPNVWKSTDAGANWSLVNQNYNWRLNHPEILCNLIPTADDSSWTGLTNESYPAFFDAHGGSITVDNNGKLHYVTTVVPAYSSHPDSLFYLYASTDNVLDWGFSYTQNDDLDKPWIYDFTTNGNGTWDQKLVGKLYTRSIKDDDLVPDPAAWTTDGTAPMDYSNRVRVSRSNDGTKLFYSWTDGDTTNIIAGPPATYHANTYPNVEYKGYDVASDMFSPTKEMSAFDAAEGGYYNHYTSPIVMPTGTGYRIPAVYISSQDGNLNATNAIDYNYISDLEIANTEYTETIVSNTNLVSDQNICVDVNTVGIKQVAGTLISGVSQNFPNPFSASSTVKVNLNKSENITLNVMNNIGQVVATQTVKGNAGSNELTIDAANLSNGIYFYSVIAGDSKVTRKMTIVK
ncbi:MAG: T9SS type A sorting domain-containing protein [Bacteroidota bacterium]|nr:T9SS type A sorting domain-containing protein [Bacteroidota bacterium]